MFNDRPVENPRLQAALNDCRRVLERYGFAGAMMIVSPSESAYFYKLAAKWSAIQDDPEAPAGFRIRAISAEIGNDLAHRRVEAAAHTVCSLSDFGSQTMDWMEQIKLLLRNAGVDFEHIPFGGQPLPRIEKIPDD